MTLPQHTLLATMAIRDTTYFAAIYLAMFKSTKILSGTQNKSLTFWLRLASPTWKYSFVIFSAEFVTDSSLAHHRPVPFVNPAHVAGHGNSLRIS